jgi:hypothetical protein
MTPVRYLMTAAVVLLPWEMALGIWAIIEKNNLLAAGLIGAAIITILEMANQP